jgi:nitroreductase
MDAIEALLTRRSVRAYTRQPVPPEALEPLLRAGLAAPSAGSARPCHLIIIDDPERLASVAAEHSAASMLLQAPVAILVCADTTRGKPDRWIQDGAAVTENILIAAHASGLGAVWVGIQPVPERIQLARRVANLPAHIQPVAMVALGYPAETPAPIERFDPGRIHHNAW